MDKDPIKASSSETAEQTFAPTPRRPMRLSLNVSVDVADALRTMAARRNKTVTDIIGDAVSMEKFLDDAHDKGDVLILRNAEGKEREIVWSLR